MPNGIGLHGLCLGCKVGCGILRVNLAARYRV